MQRLRRRSSNPDEEDYENDNTNDEAALALDDTKQRQKQGIDMINISTTNNNYVTNKKERSRCSWSHL